MTATAAEITDARLDVISHAREVLDRARSECKAFTGARTRLYRVTIAMAALEGELRHWDSVRCCEQEKDDAVRMCAHWSLRVVAIVEHDMCWEAAFYVSNGEGEEE